MIKFEFPTTHIGTLFKGHYPPIALVKVDKPKLLSWLKYREIEDKFIFNLNALPNLNFNDELLGIEIEVEGINKDMIMNHIPVGWTLVTDGSLRNQGVEFISYVLRSEEFIWPLTALYTAIQELYPNEPDFSWRTSIHAHFNMQDFSVSELGKLILIYSIFENLLFDFAGANRKNSIFCVPLHESARHNILYNFFHKKASLAQVVARWHKYSAFNLKKLCKLPHNDETPTGTAEFRHMVGTMDLNRVVIWISLLLSLVKYARSTDIETLLEDIETLNTRSHYFILRERVFGQCCRYIPLNRNINVMMCEGVKYAKMIISGYDKTKELILDSPAIKYLKKNKPARATPRKELNLDMNMIQQLQPAQVPNMFILGNVGARNAVPVPEQQVNPQQLGQPQFIGWQDLNNPDPFDIEPDHD